MAYRAEPSATKSTTTANNSESPPRVKLEEGAPSFTTVLEMRKELVLGEPFRVTAHITLEENSTGSKPVIFHIPRINDVGFSVARHRPQHGKETDDVTWEALEVDEDACGGFVLTDEPDVCVNVTQHKDFVCLQPGETWDYTFTPYNPPFRTLEDNVTSGDRIQFFYYGAELDWWDWGGMEEHTQTEVMLPCSIYNDVVQPTENNGWPTARIDASAKVQVLVVNSTEE